MRGKRRSWNTASSTWTWGRSSLRWGWLSFGRKSPEMLQSLLPWSYSKAIWKQSWVTCCRGPCLSKEFGLEDIHWFLLTLTILWTLLHTKDSWNNFSAFPPKQAANIKSALAPLCCTLTYFLWCVNNAYNCTGRNNARKLFLLCPRRGHRISIDSHKQTLQIFFIFFFFWYTWRALEVKETKSRREVYWPHSPQALR